jgi:hypothetical protein
MWLRLKCLRKCGGKFPGMTVQARNTIIYFLKRSGLLGHLRTRNLLKERSMLAAEKPDKIGATLEQTPQNFKLQYLNGTVCAYTGTSF